MIWPIGSVALLRLGQARSATNPGVPNDRGFSPQAGMEALGSTFQPTDRSDLYIRDWLSNRGNLWVLKSH
jgi:hypothetical protein